MIIISIIIATYNASKTLKRCIDSIIPQLTNSCELIIIDGGSNDVTNTIISQYKLYIAYTVSEKDNGIYDAWNKGIKVANGKWIMFVGADDQLMPYAIREYLHFIKENNCKNIDLISSKRKMIKSNGNDIHTVGGKWTWPQCLKGMPISHPGALHNINIFKSYGLFDTTYKIAGDYEMLMRIGRNLKADFINNITILVQDGGISDSYQAINEYYKIIKKYSQENYLFNLTLYIRMILSYTIKILFRKLSINVYK